MKKLLVFFAIASATMLSANPIKGGYLGRRLIISAEMSYMPNYSKWTDLFTSYNYQYGGRVNFVSGRYSEMGVSYNMYNMHAHHRYDTSLSNSGSLKGYQIGLTYRKYRESRGGLAPIGKFVDFNLYYHSNEYNVTYEKIQPFVPVIHRSTNLSASIGFGTQGIFWDRVVGNCGVRFGGPIVTLTKEKSTSDIGDNFKYMQQRLMFKDFFSVFFGVGIIL